MITQSISSWLLPGATVLALLFLISIYNGLVRARNAVANALAQISVQLQRRYDLIPNLVETAKRYLAHEKSTLEAVTEARNTAAQAAKRLAGEGTQSALTALAGAETVLEGALGRLFALQESYPDLKADRTMAQLSEELASTENRVAFARQAYNDSVMAYDNKRLSFPSSLLAGLFGFAGYESWQLESPEARQAMRVSF
ncbi:MAG: LemA family protein [Rhodospirillales bacterium]|nr:MAG: LemA family protein [Rhodospirillales bacterium]